MGVNKITISHSWVAFCLCTKTSLQVKPLIWRCVSLTSSFSRKSNSFSNERFCTRTRLETKVTQIWLFGCLWMRMILILKMAKQFLGWYCSIMMKTYSVHKVPKINKITSLPCTNLIISMTTGVTVPRNSPRRLKYNTSVHDWKQIIIKKTPFNEQRVALASFIAELLIKVPTLRLYRHDSPASSFTVKKKFNWHSSACTSHSS